MQKSFRPFGRSLAGLPLFWKLLIPFLTLILLLGVLGAFLIVRDLSSRSQAALDQELLVRSLDARSLIHDRELYLLESANFAANLQGMAEGLKSRSARPVTNLLQSVLALKTELALVAVTDRDGVGVVEFLRLGTAPDVVEKSGAKWSNNPFVLQALQGPSGGKTAGFVTVERITMLAIAAPVCSAVEPCSQVGVAIVGFPLQKLASDAIGADQPSSRESRGVTIFNAELKVLAEAGSVPGTSEPIRPQAELIRRTQGSGSGETATLFAPLEIQGTVQGTIAVTLPTQPAFASVKGAGVRLTLILLAGMAGIVAIGALLSRFLLAQVKPLMDTNRALGAGDLSSRVPVLADDELGELARGVNQMADQLQASYETLEMRVSERTEEVRRLLQERTEFFTAISHEFRTPIAVILSQAEIMLDPKFPRKDRWGPDAGRTIKDSGEQLLFLINDILELAKAEAGQIQVNLADVSLPDVMKELRRTMEGLAKAGDLELEVDLPKQLSLVRADRARLREIILNLVDNAAKYTAPGGNVTLSAEEQDGEIAVSVSDTGVGISEEAAGRIFEPFYRVPDTQSQRGQASTGLGLALAKRFVEAQDGEISFTSRPDSGTTFTFTLKAVTSHPKPPRAKSRELRVKQTVSR